MKKVFHVRSDGGFRVIKHNMIKRALTNITGNQFLRVQFGQIQVQKPTQTDDKKYKLGHIESNRGINKDKNNASNITKI